MKDRGLYQRIQGLPKPWHVIDVELRDEALEVVVEVAMRSSAVLACPECGETMTAYDHRMRRWRHLDTCQYKTIIEAKVPRGECPRHGRGAADKIVFDKFHVVAHLKKAIDYLRKAEHRKLRALGDETLTGTKYL